LSSREMTPPRVARGTDAEYPRRGALQEPPRSSSLLWLSEVLLGTTMGAVLRVTRGAQGLVVLKCALEEEKNQRD